MSDPNAAAPDPMERQLIGAVLRYVAYADWFEAQPVRRISSRRERRMMAAFNRVEFELRTIGRRVLHRQPQEPLILSSVLQEGGLRCEQEGSLS